MTSPLPFVGVTPCRIVDTRGATGPFGAPALAPGSPRNFALPSGPCAGIPVGVGAYSLNITATNTTGPGFFKVFPQGAASPVVSTLNYVAGQTIANAAIVPAGAGSGITVAAGVSGADLLIDINGYFPVLVNPGEFFGIFGTFAGGGTIFGENFSTANDSAGVIGFEPNFANGLSGVAGLSGDTTFASSFVHGPEGVTGINPFSGVLGEAENRAVVGVLLNTAGTDLAEGWVGKSGASATNFYGIEGILFSSTAADGSAGVLGVDATGSPVSSLAGLHTVGVLGLSRTAGIGVEGLARYIGVNGQLYDTAGTFLAEGMLASTFGTAGDATTGPWGVFSVGNFGATGTKHFVEPHPSDPNKVILYSSIEGRTVDTYFRGTSQFVNHEAVIQVPEDYRIVTAEEGLTVQLTPVGGFAQMYVESQDLNRIVVKSSRDVQFHYLIQGLRLAYKDVQPVQKGYEFMPRSAADKLPGYLSAEAKRRLISNGTYNTDGSVNMNTAERAGWTRIWQQIADDARAAAEEAARQRAAEFSARQ